MPGLLCFWMPLITAAIAGVVQFELPVARSLFPLLLFVVQGPGGGGRQKDGGGGGEKKASLIDRCDASAACVCC
jgi:hypothetical protein